MCFSLSGCSLLKGQVSSDLSCNIIEGILDVNSVSNILGLDKAKNVYPYIRVIDLTGKLVHCSGYHKIDTSSSLLIPYFTEDALTTDINTGHYRDLVILSIKKKRNGLEVVLSAASFKTANNKNSVYQVELSLNKVEESNLFELLDEKVIAWKTKKPSVDYDNIKQ